MLRYVIDLTKKYILLTVVLAYDLNKQIADWRSDGTFNWGRPETKTQITIEYEYNYEASHVNSIRVHTIVVSSQHSDELII